MGFLPYGKECHVDGDARSSHCAPGRAAAGVCECLARRPASAAARRRKDAVPAATGSAEARAPRRGTAGALAPARRAAPCRRVSTPPTPGSSGRGSPAGATARSVPARTARNERGVVLQADEPLAARNCATNRGADRGERLDHPAVHSAVHYSVGPAGASRSPATRRSPLRWTRSGSVIAHFLHPAGQGVDRCHEIVCHGCSIVGKSPNLTRAGSAAARCGCGRGPHFARSAAPRRSRSTSPGAAAGRRIPAAGIPRPPAKRRTAGRPLR